MNNDHVIYAVVIFGVVAASFVAVVLEPSQAPAIIGLATLICVQLLALLAGKKTAEKVEEVRTALDATNATCTETHRLANSEMTAQLLQARALTQRIAKLTKDPVDREAARIADELYRRHVSADEAMGQVAR